MPETQESKASYLVLKHVLASLNNKGTSMALESIEIDATDNECSRLPRDHPARQGLPYAIDSSSTVKRGTNKSQTFVYPEMWRTGGKAKSNMPIQWLTHTSIQLYSHTVYENTIKIVDKKIRKFRVGTALVFTDYVLDFLSSDLVFQPTWSFSHHDPPPSPFDFYDAHWDFLPALAGWMHDRLNLERNGLASETRYACAPLRLKDKNGGNTVHGNDSKIFSQSVGTALPPKPADFSWAETNGFGMAGTAAQKPKPMASAMPDRDHSGVLRPVPVFDGSTARVDSQSRPVRRVVPSFKTAGYVTGSPVNGLTGVAGPYRGIQCRQSCIRWCSSWFNRDPRQRATET
ncbi:hypothetical protein B0H14DRAFT_3142914 [Mycena olivaceomarginata]|nr:hypothetical protein B0H14DRAFT_3142914 [Mycena olivaceomarginata]